jgi:hypothetical protein
LFEMVRCDPGILYKAIWFLTTIYLVLGAATQAAPIFNPQPRRFAFHKFPAATHPGLQKT